MKVTFPHKRKKIHQNVVTRVAEIWVSFVEDRTTLKEEHGI